MQTSGYFILALVLLVWDLSAVAIAQRSLSEINDVPGRNGVFQEKNTLLPKRSLMEIQSAASSWFDVQYYRLALNIAAPSGSLKGTVTIAGACRDTVQTLTFDLVNRMRIDSVMVNGQRRPFIQKSASFDITLSHPPSIGEALTIDISYGGFPIATGFGSFVFDVHSGIPWVYSLSEPYGAKDWWPCKDDPGDKADSADIVITCESDLKVGSQGILVSTVLNGDGTATTHWKERYPIASYLISVALTNYAQFSNWFHYSSTDSMEILNYVLPEHYNDALEKLPRVVSMLEIFSRLFGLYPFIKEKYGHAEFGRGGAMEHQTMTSTTTFEEDVISHELAHQWFGDMITCRTWADLWLNEGFAQYSSALYREQHYGVPSYREYINRQMEQAKLSQGAIGVPDTSSVRNLFNSARIYSKGAVVLHMLRHVLGDSVFFHTLYVYANTPALRYSTAAIHDFQLICESVSGKNLSFFFQEWISGDRFPDYSYSWTWNSSGNPPSVTLRITQTAIGTTPSFYVMPIDIRLTAAGYDTTITVFNDATQQTLSIPFPVKPVSVAFDPDGWILKFLFNENDVPPSVPFLEQNYPNPFNSPTTIAYRLSKRGHVTLNVYDILGREIALLANATQSAGRYEVQWNPEGIAGGIYIYRLTTESAQLQNKMVLLK